MNTRSVFSIAIVVGLAFAGGVISSVLLLPDDRVSQTADGSDPSDGVFGKTSGRFSSSIADKNNRSAKELIADFQDASKDSDDLERAGRLWGLSQNLTVQNAREVVIGALKDSNDTERSAAAKILFTRWAQLDARAAISFARELPRGKLRDDATLSSLSGWASNSFEAARQWVERLPQGELKSSAQLFVISVLAESDPDRALEITAKNTRGKVYDYANAIFSTLVRRDPEQAAESASNLPIGAFRTQALRVVADHWSHVDPDSTMAWLKTLPDESLTRQDIYSAVLRDWSSSDFDGALDWLRKQPEGAPRNDILQRLCSVTASDNPANALKLVDLVTSAKTQDRMLEIIAHAWSGKDPVAARQWADSQTDPVVKKVVSNSVIATIAWEHPEQAAELALKSPPNEQAPVIDNVASAWASRDAPSAAKWAGALANEDTREVALGTVMANWVQQDPENALKWYANSPPGKERDYVVSKFVKSLGDNNPDLAMQWARSIQDPQQRESSQVDFASKWMKYEPAKARVWINNSNLSAEKKKNLLSSDSNH